MPPLRMPSSYRLTRSSGMFQPTRAPTTPPVAAPAPAPAMAAPMRHSLTYDQGKELSRHCSASTILSCVLPHGGMLPVGRLSFWPRFSLFNSMVEGCGHVVEGCGGGQRMPRSGALSTVAAGAPQAHRPHVHSLPGAKRPAPVGREVSSVLFHTSAGMTVGLRSLPRIISFARSARQALTRRCNVRSCAAPA